MFSVYLVHCFSIHPSISPEGMSPQSIVLPDDFLVSCFEVIYEMAGSTDRRTPASMAGPFPLSSSSSSSVPDDQYVRTGKER